MDFANERYIRLYVRDTITWKRLGWDAQNCLTQLLRRADRSGVIDLGGIEPWEAPVVLCSAPEDQARRGMARALELGCVVHDGDRLVFPRYMEANEAAMSDRQRAKESRARRAAVSQIVTAPSRNVTAESQIATPPSHAVTARHSASQRVTPCRAVPCRAEPSRAEPEDLERERAHEREGDPDPEDLGFRAIREFQPRLPNIATGFEFGSWCDDWRWIGMQKPDEREAVIKTLVAHPHWSQTNWRRLSPKHLRKHWQLYSVGQLPAFSAANDNGSANGKRKPSRYGSSEVSKPEEFKNQEET